MSDAWGLLWLLAAVPFGLVWLGYRIAEARTTARRSAGLCCPACGEGDPREVHPEAFRCPACGAEWGPGWDRQREEERLMALAALSPEEQEHEIAARLREAVTLLTSAEGPLRHPILSRDNGVVYDPALDEALVDVALAHDHLRTVGLLDPDLRRQLERGGFRPEEEPAPLPGSHEQARRWRLAAQAVAGSPLA